jgi:Mg2+-importing ATPase
VFQTGWFVESMLTEVLALLIIRTTRPALKSRPSRWLLWTSIGTVILTVALPYWRVGQWIGLQPLPLTLLGFMIGLAALYGFVVEATKRRFFRRAQL